MGRDNALTPRPSATGSNDGEHVNAGKKRAYRLSPEGLLKRRLKSLSPERTTGMQVALVKGGLRKGVSLHHHAGVDEDFDEMGF